MSLEIPPGIQLDRDEEGEKFLLAKARKWIEGDSDKRKEGWHASDILMPRKSYFRRLDPDYRLSDREVGLFLIGKVVHAFVLSELSPGMVDIRNTDDGSEFSKELGLWYSPDKMGDNNVPVEFKTNRGMYPAKTIGDLETYIKQVLVYMVARNSTEGRIVVCYTNAKDESGKTSPQFRVYQVRISPEEIESCAYQIRTLLNDLSNAVARKDPTHLPLCPAWACHPEQCPYWTKCKPPGRYESYEYLKGKRK